MPKPITTHSSIPVGFTAEWVWGDDAETIVYAQGYGPRLTAIFRFKLDRERPSTSLANRIVTCYHELDVSSPGDSFPDRESMREKLWGAVEQVWPQCIEHPGIAGVDVVVDIDVLPNESASWSVYHHPWFGKFVGLLRQAQATQMYLQSPSKTIDFESLTRFEQLGGRGCATKVQTDPNSKDFFVFKGVDFRTFLTYYDEVERGSSDTEEEEDDFTNLVKTWHHANEILTHIPAHPNIIPSPTTFVTIQEPPAIRTKDESKAKDKMPVVCGCLYPFYANGDMGSRIETSNSATGKPISLALKARWCYEMATAIKHTHLVAHTYHMDIKPGNFLVDDHEHLLLIDWEQSDAPCTTLAPEADGTWDVTEQKSADGVSRLVYTKYEGPDRRNTEVDIGGRSWNLWNVFPLWAAECPRALELAEVFSLGRSMWMLLRQPDMDDWDEIEHPSDLVTEWIGAPGDVPEEWKGMVDRCMAIDPNERPGLVELTEFWEKVAVSVRKM
ncbi:hypothetical protein BJX63DRAFT_331814 [Aspergillus granulosus]|uniref:Protein kinase domain-containing protein n=1 Tax=Aspergillus granulosus TaxID=176169 RepID=A0ABR4H3C2_9EURO